MRKAAENFMDIMNKAYESVALVCLIIVIVSMVVQVFTRYALNSSLVGTEEFARFAFIWATMLGASLCVRDGMHAVVSLLNDSLRGRIKNLHLTVIDILVIALALVMVYQGMKMTKMTMRQLSPILRISMGYIYLAIPVGCLGILLNSLNNLMQRSFPKGQGGDAA